ncbi:MAG: DEAD/DEAH box helicase [Oscillochloridaceae bacterium umkhey_bin13]
MSVPLRLAAILPQGEAALQALSPSLAQQVFVLDWTDVATITPEQLDALFAAVPAAWSFEEFAEILDLASLAPTVAVQLSTWVEGRQGSESQVLGVRDQVSGEQVSGFRFQVSGEQGSALTPDPLHLTPDQTPDPLHQTPALTPAQTPAPLHPILTLERVTNEYRSYLQSEFRAKDPTLKAALDTALTQPRFLAQDPFYQAHRPFRAGLPWTALGLDPSLARVMARRAGSARAYQHQATAIQTLLAPEPTSVVVTTGTGSGKTEAFLLPVVQNAITDATTFRRPGLTAILIYPMNALANDQYERIRAYLEEAGWTSSVEVAQYDRSTTQQRRRELRERPPHILLTNYVMLEYLLVRPADRDAIFANHRCRFLVLDEVHTYRGTLGSNIALLVRRLRAHLAGAPQTWLPTPPEELRARRFPPLVPVGTSATIKSIADGAMSHEDRLRLRDEAVQDFFGKLTGVAPTGIHVIGEELEQIPAIRYQVSGVRFQGSGSAELTPDTLHQTPELTPGTFHQTPELTPGTLHQTPDVDLWVELDGVVQPEAIRLTAGLWNQLVPSLPPQVLPTARSSPTPTPGTPTAATWNLTPATWNLIPLINRWLVRQPLSLEQIAQRVQAEVPGCANTPIATVRAEVAAALIIGAALPDATPGALRLRAHRLIRGGWQFHRCVNPDCGCLYPMGEATCGACGHPTAPLFLCRNCGAHYLRFVGDDPDDPTSGPLRPSTSKTAGSEWMLYEPARFATTVGALDEEDEAPPPGARNRKQTKQLKQRPVVEGSFDPQQLIFSSAKAAFPLDVTLVPARTICLCCGATLGNRNVLSPVALGTSAAVKVMAEGLVEALAEAHRADPTHDGKERLLIFSDSRQDAAHQARFITFAGRYDRMRRRVVALLGQQDRRSMQDLVQALGQWALDANDTPQHPRGTFATADELERVRAYEEAPLLDEIALNAGYRATLINLGLVQIAYDRLDEYVATYGATLVQTLGFATTAQVAYLCRCLLDEIRVRGCLSRPMLRYHPQHPNCPAYVRAAEWERQVKQPSGYALGHDELAVAYMERTDVPQGVRLNNPWRRPKTGGRSPSLERILTLLGQGFGAAQADETTMVALLRFLQAGSFLIATDLYGARQHTKLLQVNAETIRLGLVNDAARLRCGICSLPVLGATAGLPCPRCHGRLEAWPASELAANRTVQRIRAATMQPLVAAEHTAQVPTSQRAELEQAFKAPQRTAALNLLACSPTLEMGIDVGGLDAVILRNVPPRPDNYAQRGGRAGRRTRVGLVLGYARSTPHDQYFYDKPTEMIAGEVPAPALALGNRDTILRHLNAIAIGAAEPGLAGKMLHYVNLKGEVHQGEVDALLAGVRAQTDHALELAHTAWGAAILPAAGLSEADLRTQLERLPARIQEVIDRTARQVIELRAAVERFYDETRRQRGREAVRAAELIGNLLGLEVGERDADDRSSGYPLRRFAEFGLLPGYEFPAEPATLRLHGDAHEDDPISVARRFGIAQFQPNATVYARGVRWNVIGLDTASPWNPRSEGPSWLYRQCRHCSLRFDADEPACPRCGSQELGRAYPAAEYGGFLAMRDESPILEEEDRYAVSNRVTGYPQWGGDVAGRWTTGPGWGLRLSRNEEVRWLNEGPPPNPAERESTIILSEDAAGYRLCASCGNILSIPVAATTGKGARRQPRASGSAQDPFGHRQGCPEAGRAPTPLALMTTTRAEVLRLLAPVPDGADADDLATWGLTLGYALRLGMRHRYMLDGPEIEFLLEGPWAVNQQGRTYQQLVVSFIDPSVGGSGYLPRIANELHLVAGRAIEHLDHANCTTACYRCLKSYENQRYHDKLRWPRIMGDLEALAATAPHARPLERGDIDDPAPWLEAYAAGVGSPLELRFMRLFEAHGFHPERQVPVSPDDGPTISVADFAVPAQRLAIYIDGAAFHRGANRARDAHLRERLRTGSTPWTVVELRAADLARGAALVGELQYVDHTDKLR